MPPIPAVCQPIADQIDALETADALLRTNLAVASGGAAWNLLAQIGAGRTELDDKRAELDACISTNTAAIQANVVVMDLAAPPGQATTRVAQLWDVTPAVPTQVATVPVVADSFAFDVPLPASFALSVVSTGQSEVIGPDFRSAPMASPPPATRVEMVVGQVVRLRAVDLDTWITQALPLSRRVGGSAGFAADLVIMAGSVRLQPGRLLVDLRGQADIAGPVGGSSRASLSITLTIGITPAGAPGATDPFDVVAVHEARMEMPGIIGAMLDAMASLIRSSVNEALTDQIRVVLRREMPRAVLRAFALPTLPPDVGLSMRRLAITEDALEFQPVLGTVGTALSTFAPPPIAPP